MKEGYVKVCLQKKQLGGRGSTYRFIPLVLYEVFYILTFSLENRLQNIVCCGWVGGR